MNGEHLLAETAVITDRAEQTDDDGNLVRDGYGNVQTVETIRTVRCWHAQRASTEIAPFADATFDAWFPPGDPISSTSKVTIAGTAYEVIGMPTQLTNPRTSELALVQAEIRRTTG